MELAIEHMSQVSDPVHQWSFDVLLGGNKPSWEVSRVVATERTLSLTYVVTETLDLKDFTSSGITVRLYQKVDKNPKYIDLSYNLKKLKATTFDLDCSLAKFGLDGLMLITQVYTYDGLTVHSK